MKELDQKNYKSIETAKLELRLLKQELHVYKFSFLQVQCTPRVMYNVHVPVNVSLAVVVLTVASAWWKGSRQLMPSLRVLKSVVRQAMNLWKLFFSLRRCMASVRP